MKTPQSVDWDFFWNRGQSKDPSKASFSKRRMIKVIDPFLKPNFAVLDAGCGSGFFSKYFCERGLKTVSLDYSDKALQLTKNVTASQSQLIKADMLHERFLASFNCSFDLIFSDGLFEHFSLENQDKIMQNFKALLNKGGMVITFVPNRWSPWELIRPWFMPGIEEKPFVLKELVALHERNGFQVISQGGINTLPFKFSPEGIASYFGMLLYTIAQKNV